LLTSWRMQRAARAWGRAQQWRLAPGAGNGHGFQHAAPQGSRARSSGILWHVPLVDHVCAGDASSRRAWAQWHRRRRRPGAAAARTHDAFASCRVSCTLCWSTLA